MSRTGWRLNETGETSIWVGGPAGEPPRPAGERRPRKPSLLRPHVETVAGERGRGLDQAVAERVVAAAGRGAAPALRSLFERRAHRGDVGEALGEEQRDRKSVV